MFDIFQPVIDFFNFVGGLISTIAKGISGVISIIGSILNLILSICKILPSPLYPCFIAFISIYSTIFIYKIFRKG